MSHLLNVRESEMEEQRMGFGDMGRSLVDCPDADLPDPYAEPTHRAAIVEKAKLGCITAILMCRDRRQRLAFILGEVFGVRSEVGGEVLEISSENFRQLLARARRDLYQFMQGKCGLANPRNPCRCSKKAAAFMERDWLDPQRRQFTGDRLPSIQEAAPSRREELQDIDRARRKTFYDGAGAAIEKPLPLEDAPPVAPEFQLGALRANIRDSQQRGQPFPDSSRRAMAAGARGYFAFLRGQRVLYLGPQGDHHTEWFPGARSSRAPE